MSCTNHHSDNTSKWIVLQKNHLGAGRIGMRYSAFRQMKPKPPVVEAATKSQIS